MTRFKTQGLVDANPSLQLDGLLKETTMASATEAGRRFLEEIRDAQVRELLDPNAPSPLAIQVDAWVAAEWASGDPDRRVGLHTRFLFEHHSGIDGDLIEPDQDFVIAAILGGADDTSRLQEQHRHLVQDLGLARQATFFSGTIDAPGAPVVTAYDRTSEQDDAVTWTVLRKGVSDFVERVNTAATEALIRRSLDSLAVVGQASLAPQQLDREMRRSVVEIDLGGTPLTVPFGSGDRPEWPWGEPVWVVTAHNPGGRPCSDEWNRAADAELRRHLNRQGVEFLDALGRSKGGSWQEASVALVGSERVDPIEVGRRFGQLAVFRLHNWRRTVVRTGVDPNPVANQPDVVLPSHTMLGDSMCNCGHDESAHEEIEDLFISPCVKCDCVGMDYVDELFLHPCRTCGHAIFLHGESQDDCGDGPCRSCRCATFFDGPLCALCGASPLVHDALYGSELAEECPGYMQRCDAVDLNQASAEALMELPGVTRSVAMAIITHRPTTFVRDAMVSPTTWKAVNKAVASGRVAV